MKVSRTARAATRNGTVSNERRRHERELVRLFQTEPSAREAVLEEFRPLARQVARRYHRGEEPLEDLEQVALLGLFKALQRFDCDRGAPFVTFALPTMTGEVRRHFRDTGWAVHVSRGAQELAQKVTSFDRQTEGDLTAEQCAEHLGLTVEQVVGARVTMRAMRADSLDRAAPNGEPALSPPASEDRGYEAAEARIDIARLSKDLPERERKVLAMRYSQQLTQSEIARQVGVSQMHVSRILRRSIAAMGTRADAGWTHRTA